MPSLSKVDAAEKLAIAVEKVKPTALPEIYAELFPQLPSSSPLVKSEIVEYIRNKLEVEEIVDLWNVVFPEDRHVWYNEETKAIHYNEAMVGYAD